MRLDDPGLTVTALDALEMPNAVERHELGSRVNRNRRMVVDATYEVPRHRLCQGILANEQVDVPGGLREEHRGLAGGIASADDDDLLSDAQLRLHARGRVVHAGAFELRHVWNRRLAVLCPRRDDQRPRIDATAVFEVHRVQRTLTRQLRRPLRDHQLRPELLSLRVRSFGEVET